MLTAEHIATWWDETYKDETYTPPWSKAVSGLTVEQAVWKPAPGRHSIWQIVEHMSFWREFKLRELDGEPRDEEKIGRRNWAEPDEVSEAAWSAAVERFGELQMLIKDAMEQSPEKAAILRNFIEHDAYHIGQIMLLRSLQGLPPLDSFG